VRAIEWNPAAAPVGHVAAVADAGNVVAVLGDAGAAIFSSGALVATDRATTDWVSAQTVHGADGAARWILGIDARGRVHHLRGASVFEDVSARYGVEGKRVLGASMIDPDRAALLLDGAIAVADGRRVTLYGSPAPLASFAGGGGFAAGVGAGASAGAVVLLDPRMAARTFELPGATAAALGPDGRLYATTRRALYASTARGDLALLYDAGADVLHGLVVSGSHVWLADGPELAVVDGDHVSESTGTGLAPDAHLAPSASGDVWVIAPTGVRRFAIAGHEPPLRVAWSSTLGPIFARSCAGCHLPGGISGTDLSTPDAWQSLRSRIVERVVTSRTMPPEGHPLSDVDRTAIGSWAAAAR
jgi:hypothetical protein